MALPSSTSKPLDLDLSRVGQALVRHLREGLPPDLQGLAVELVSPTLPPRGDTPGIEVRVLAVKVLPQFKNLYASLPGHGSGVSPHAALELHVHLHPRSQDPLLQLRLLGCLIHAVLERPTLVPMAAPDALAPAEHVQLSILDDPAGNNPPPIQPGLFLSLRNVHGSFPLHASPALTGEPHAVVLPTNPHAR